MFVVQNVNMEEYLIGIGKRIKDIRKGDGRVISDIAAKADVTSGLISRIENGRTIPSLPVLIKIINALDVEVTAFFSGVPQVNGADFIVSRKDENSTIEKEDDADGFKYTYILGK